jgi:hypothetical protein
MDVDIRRRCLFSITSPSNYGHNHPNRPSHQPLPYLSPTDKQTNRQTSLPIHLQGRVTPSPRRSSSQYVNPTLQVLFNLPFTLSPARTSCRTILKIPFVTYRPLEAFLVRVRLTRDGPGVPHIKVRPKTSQAFSSIRTSFVHRSMQLPCRSVWTPAVADPNSKRGGRPADSLSRGTPLSTCRQLAVLQ